VVTNTGRGAPSLDGGGGAEESAAGLVLTHPSLAGRSKTASLAVKRATGSNVRERRQKKEYRTPNIELLETEAAQRTCLCSFVVKSWMTFEPFARRVFRLAP
jgi:hypothetical protein